MAEGSPEFELVCDADASGYGLDGVLLQSGRPIAFWSKTMLPAEKNYHVTEQELLAVTELLRAFSSYIDGVHFTLITESQSEHIPGHTTHYVCLSVKHAAVNIFSALVSLGNTGQVGTM